MHMHMHMHMDMDMDMDMDMSHVHAHVNALAAHATRATRWHARRAIDATATPEHQQGAQPQEMQRAAEPPSIVHFNVT